MGFRLEWGSMPFINSKKVFIFLFSFFIAFNVSAYKFGEDEFFGLAQTVQEIRSDLDPQKYIFVGIGRSPAAIIATQQIEGDDALNIPLTWSNSGYEEKMKKIRD